MIVSHRYRFIFVKTMKTAGTSIELFLSQRCGELDIVTPILPHVDPHRPRNDNGFFNHMPASEIRRRLPEVWSGYLKFCVERNPWDKTLSHYFMLKNSPSHGHRTDLTLDEYLEEGKYCLNYPIYMDETASAVIVDRVLRFESLAEELVTLFKGLGVPFSGDLGARAKSEWRSDRRPYREVFTPGQAARVAQIYEKEIAVHGYQF